MSGVGVHIQSGRLRALAVTSAKRLAPFPHVPTVAESGVAGFEVTTWGGTLAPAGIPRPVLDRLNAEMQRAVKAPQVIERYTALGVVAVASTPEQFAELIRSETVKWAKVIKFSEAQGN